MHQHSKEILQIQSCSRYETLVSMHDVFRSSIKHNSFADMHMVHVRILALQPHSQQGNVAEPCTIPEILVNITIIIILCKHQSCDTRNW